MTLPQSPKSRKRISTVQLVFATVAIPVISAVVAIFFYRLTFGGSLSDKTSTWGEFGDFIGGVINPVAGLITIVLLVLTLRSQQDDLAEQRKQIGIQGFEQTFFNWLSIYRDSVSALEVEKPGKNLTGIAALMDFTAIARDHQMVISAYTRNDYDQGDTEQKASLRREIEIATKESWQVIFRENRPQLGRIIQILHTFIHWVDEHPILSPEEKWRYVAIIRSQLSSAEVDLLFLNSFLHQGKTLSEYIERYALLENILFTPQSILQLCAHMEALPFKLSALDSDIAQGKRKLAEEP